MRNASLNSALKDYCYTALAILNSKISRCEDVPHVIKEKIEVGERGKVSLSQAPEIQWYILVDRSDRDLIQTDVRQTAVQALQVDPQVAKHLNTLVGTSELRTRVDSDSCLRAFIIRLLQEQQDLTLQEAVFDRLYKEFEDYFYRDTVEYRFLSPLNNFRTEIEKVELSPNFSIIKIPAEERGQMLSQSREFGLFIQYNMLPFNEYALELFLEVPKVFGEGPAVPDVENMPSQIARKQFDEACSALRLYKSGAVSHDFVRIGSTSWELHGGTYTVGSVGMRAAIGPQQILSKQEVAEFLKFLEFFQRVRKRKQNRTEIALRRFDFAYERVRPEDKLIDYLIGFEALLLKGDERQELEYRLALRGSVMLGKTAQERQTIFKELKTAYRERSNIVHGGTVREAIKIASDRVKFNEFVENIEQRLRASIKEFLALSETQSESKVIKGLDDRIVGGS
jgi:hypothetical protein